MPHARTTIRAAFVTLVEGIASVAASSVYEDWPHTIPSTPAVRVLTSDEDIDRQNKNDYLRSLDVVCEVLVRAATGAQALADQVILEIEQAVAADDTLGIGLAQAYLAGITVDIDPDDQVTVMATAVFTTTYWADRRTPQTIE